MDTGAPLLPKRLVLPWACALALAVLLSLGLGSQRADYPTPFALAGMYPLVVGAELVVFLVVVPLAVGRGRGGLGELAVVWAMAAPVVAVAWWVSDRDAASVAASQGYLVAMACAVSGYLRLDADGRFRPWYWLTVGALGAGAPIVAFVAADLLRVDATWLAAFSPFWVVWRAGQRWELSGQWVVPFVALVVAAGALHGLAARRATRDG